MNEDILEKWLKIKNSMTPEIKPEKCGLLIIDMQEYQVRKNWTAYKLANAMVPGLLDYFMDQTETIVEPNIKKLIDFFRENNLKVIYTMYSSFQKEGGDLPARQRALNSLSEQQFHEAVFPHKDHPSSRIIDTLKPGESDLVVVKNTSGVFTTTKLEFYLRNMGVEQLFVTGVVTNQCVEGAARTASELGFDVFMIADACAAWSPEIHNNSLKSFALLFGYVMTTEEALAALRGKLIR
jgi:nicotinamidase-related amidase